MYKYIMIMQCLLFLCIGDLILAKDLTISLIVPCHVNHAHHLYDLLQMYTNQTVLPNEIVISISEAKNISPAILENIAKTEWPFEVKILVSEYVKHPGENRNIACQNATGDIFICQDADDIPHPQRNEVIKYFFEYHKCDHLAHTYFFSADATAQHFFQKIILQEVKYITPKNFAEAWKHPITNGNVSISREVFQQVSWPSAHESEDVIFNKAVYDKFQNRIVLDTPLLIYRNYLSTFLMGLSNRGL